MTASIRTMAIRKKANVVSIQLPRAFVYFEDAHIVVC